MSMNDTTTAPAPEVTFEIVPKDITLPPEEKQSLITSFSPMLSRAKELLSESKGITTARLARVSRLQFRKLRGESEALRKSLKEHHLRMGKAIDGAHNILVAAVSEEEQRMEDIEKAEERREAERVEAIRQTRHDLLVPLGVHESIFNSPGLGTMSDDAFGTLLRDSTEMHAARIKREQEEAAAKLAREVEEAKERERIRIDNERLLKEAAEREAAAKLEREKAAAEKAALEAKLAAERAEAERKAEYERQQALARQQEIEKKAAEERAAAEAKHRAAEAKAKAEREELEKKAEAERVAREKLEEAEKARVAAAEQKRLAEEAAAEKALLAPDKEKLIAVAKTMRGIPAPALKSKKANQAWLQLLSKITNLANWIEEKAEEL